MSLTALKTASRFSRADLHPYQNRAVDFILQNPKCALWLDMGMGKTASVLTAIADLFDQFEIARVLVIAPKRVALKTWPAEAIQWAHTEHLTLSNIKGSPKQREQVLADPSQIHVINRELVPWLCETLGDDWPYDMVVIDEASSFKSAKSTRFKALRKRVPQIDRMVQMTGTPAGNGLLDLWSQIYLLDQGDRLGKSQHLYKLRYFESDFSGFKWTPREGSEEKIHAKLDDICLTMAADDYLSLPECLEEVVPVELPTSARKQYRELEREFLLSLDSGEDVAVFSAAALTNKLLQFANGAIYTDEDRNWRAVHDAKLHALAELIEAANGQPVLVAYNYRTDLERLQTHLPDAVLLGDDPNTIDAWNLGQIPILLAHPASAGHGLNLQAGGDICIWFGLNWSLELQQQFNKRLHRQGQTRPVSIYYLAVENTVDQSVIDAWSLKDRTQRALLDALKADVSRRI